MGSLPDEAYVALETLQKHGWSMLAQTMKSGNQAHYEKMLAESEEQMRACEPWTSLILDEWAKGNGNRVEADNAWLESVFNASNGRIQDAFESGDQ